MPLCSAVSQSMTGSGTLSAKKRRNLCLRLISSATGVKRMWIFCRICRSSFNSFATPKLANWT